MNVTNVQELAERAWRSVGKTITFDGVTVKVRAFGRWLRVRAESPAVGPARLLASGESGGHSESADLPGYGDRV